jgi:hypothetical protein
LLIRPNGILWNVRWIMRGSHRFKLLELVTVMYKDENLQAKAEKVLGHIIWLLEEAQARKKSREIRSTGGTSGTKIRTSLTYS